MNTEVTVRHGHLEGSKQALVKDLKGVVVDSENLLKELASASGEEIAAALNRVESKLGAGRARLDAARLAFSHNASVAAAATQAYVKENPWKVVAIAVATGLITAVISSRR
jgi:ElaB/YqjD/DUF883 family membrane-anchored ribosome-binding protein